MPRRIVVTMLYSTSVYSGEGDTHVRGRGGGRDAVCRTLSSQPCSNCISLFSIPVIVTHTHTRAHKLLAHLFVTLCFESTTSTEGGREGGKQMMEREDGERQRGK